ncbi:hypothetical protein UYSO10_4238 [Kosakonia radicincitans]|nr:hypothetical protein UYSO10_4238 [Kosakonia radicincitans]
MNSLTTQYRRSQLVVLPVTGGKCPVRFVYGVRVQGAIEPVSYPFAEWVVGDFNSQAEKNECANLTADSGTSTASPSASSAGSQKRSALSICVKATRLSSSSVNSEK